MKKNIILFICYFICFRLFDYFTVDLNFNIWLRILLLCILITSINKIANMIFAKNNW